MSCVFYGENTLDKSLFKNCLSMYAELRTWKRIFTRMSFWKKSLKKKDKNVNP